MNITHRPSPNFDARDGHVIDMLVLHYTGMPSAKAAIERLCDPAAKVSAHYVMEEDGNVLCMVDEKNRAWHAGVSFWRGQTNINQRSIGIEIVNPGHEFGYVPFPATQMQSIIALCKEILARNPAIPAHNVVGHSDVAPSRKEDPGELFDWKLLAEAGVGLWPNTSSAPLAPSLRLADYGYETADLPKAISAFQRHFRPAHPNGIWDDECAGLLAALLQVI